MRVHRGNARAIVRACRYSVADRNRPQIWFRLSDFYMQTILRWYAADPTIYNDYNVDREIL